MNLAIDIFNKVAGNSTSIILVVMGVLVILEMIQAISQRSIFRMFLLIVLLAFIAAVPVYSLVNPAVILQEELALDKGNIAFSKGNEGKLILRTKRDIIEPISLRITNTWANLIYEADYRRRSPNEIIMNYEFGNNSEDNRIIADKGFTFAYKTRIRKW